MGRPLLDLPRQADRARVVRTRRGARLVQDGLVLSEVLDRPGPTHTLFDVLAATIAALSPGPRVAVLGFAAGGLVAPLRAMGFAHPIEAVDLSLDGEAVFRALSDGWCGDVRVAEGDAIRWLSRQRRPFDLILEDLSADGGEGVTKPPVSLGTLPALMKRHLTPAGFAVTNVLPVPGTPWTRLLPHLAQPFRDARVTIFDDWENRLLMTGDQLPSARAIGAALRRHLAAIGSAETHAFSIRALRRSRRARS